MPGPAFQIGDSVSLHPIEEEDYEFIQYGRNHPEVRVPLTDTTIKSVEDVAEMLEDAAYHFLICTNDDDPEPVGVVAFPWVRDDADIGSLMYWVAPEHQSEGYVTEGTSLFLDYSFGECGFHKVNATVVASNEASASVLEKLGFQREGTRRQENIVDGERVDGHLYGLLADEWLKA